MKIGILTAMEKEYHQLVSLLNINTNTNLEIGTYRDNTICVCQCGIGKVNSAIGTMRLLRLKPDLIVSTGCAGGIGNDLKLFDVVIGNLYAQHDVFIGGEYERGHIQGLQHYFMSDPLTIRKAKNLQNTHIGLICSGDQFVKKDEAESIKKDFPNCLAVDMESAAIAQVCNIHKIPFISIRVISDLPLKHDNIEQYDNFWNNISEKSFNSVKEFIKIL